MLLMGYGRLPFRYFERHLRIAVGLDENDIQLILRHNISNFIKYEIPPGVYSIKDASGAVYTMGDQERTLYYKYDNSSLKTDSILTRFGVTFGTLSFDEKSFPITLLGFKLYGDYKPAIAIPADSPVVYTTEKI